MNEVEQLRAEAQAMRKVLLAVLMSAPSEHQRRFFHVLSKMSMYLSHPTEPKGPDAARLAEAENAILEQFHVQLKQGIRIWDTPAAWAGLGAADPDS